MNIIKLDATTSTNDYLKGMLDNQVMDNFTVVAADFQTRGKGQVGAEWASQKAKNLTFSLLVKDTIANYFQLFRLNKLVSLAVIKVLQGEEISDLSVKWPNDILSGSKKLAGILIENSIKSSGEIYSVVGIGLNVNQVDFEQLPQATSMALVAGRSFERDEIMLAIVKQIKQFVAVMIANNDTFFDQLYLNYLFKKGVSTTFVSPEGIIFTGIIQGVTPEGRLVVLKNSGELKEFDTKQVKLVY